MALGINQLLNWLLSWVPSLHWSVAPDSIIGYVAASLIHIGLLINLVAVGALVFIWLERKVAGRIQDRLGPTRVGGKFGWLQTLADGLKLITKEDLMPGDADGFLFRIAPYVSFCASFTVFFAIPFAGRDMPFVAQHLNVGVFFILAVLGLEVFGVILAGYASASKWSLFGAMREAAQVVSYEVPLGMCAVVPVLLAGSMDLVFIGDRQAGWFTNWYRVPRPVHVHHFLGLLHLCHGQRQSRAVRLGRSRKRTGGRLPHRILRPALELLLHGRVRLDARRQPAWPRSCFSAAGMARFRSRAGSAADPRLAGGTNTSAMCSAA